MASLESKAVFWCGRQPLRSFPGTNINNKLLNRNTEDMQQTLRGGSGGQIERSPPATGARARTHTDVRNPQCVILLGGKRWKQWSACGSDDRANHTDGTTVRRHRCLHLPGLANHKPIQRCLQRIRLALLAARSSRRCWDTHVIRGSNGGHETALFGPSLAPSCSPCHLVSAGKNTQKTMHDSSYYLNCMVGGTLACGLTHAAVVSLDVAKCRAQASHVIVILRPVQGFGRLVVRIPHPLQIGWCDCYWPLLPYSVSLLR